MKKVTKSKNDIVIDGVLAGISEHFNIDPLWLRLLVVYLLFTEFPIIWIYLILTIIIPEK